MPIYRYSCSNCNTVFNVLEFTGDPTTQHCEQCNSKRVKRIPSVPGVQFKGKGFYVTDRRSGRSSAAKPVENGKGKESQADTATSAANSDSDKAKKPEKPSKPAAS